MTTVTIPGTQARTVAPLPTAAVAMALTTRLPHEALPFAADAADMHVRAIEAEQRIDARGVVLNGLRVDAEGYLCRGKGRLDFTDWSWSQLRSMAPSGCTLRNNFNRWLSGMSDSSTFTARMRRTGVGWRQLYAAVSDSYAITDGHDMLSRIVERLPRSTRARMSYDADTTRLRADLVLAQLHQAADVLEVGKDHRIVLRYTTRDDGGERHRLKLAVERLVCLNGMTIPVEIAGMDKIHQGDPALIIQAVDELVAQANNHMSEFSGRWFDAARVQVFGPSRTNEQVREVFGKLVEAEIVQARGHKREETAERLVAAYNDEPGETMQSLCNAVTRAAHGFSWRPEVSEELEAQAGTMLWYPAPTKLALDLGA